MGQALHDVRRHQIDLAQSLRICDRKLDQMNRQTAQLLTEKMSVNPERIEEYLHLIFIARHLEWVGDHAKNIAEDTVYAAAAEDIRYPNNSLRFEVEETQFAARR